MTSLTKLYLLFLQHVLRIVNEMNLEFQSEKPKIQYLYPTMESAFRTILDFYIQPEYLGKHSVTEIQYRNPSNFAELENVYLGAKCIEMLTSRNLSLSKEEEHSFRVDCLNFYVECAHQIYTRFPFNSDYIRSLKHLKF